MAQYFSLTSLGCAKNLVDSEEIAGSLIREGFVLNPNPEEAQVAIVNTCAFLREARREAIKTVKKMVALKKNPRSRLKTIVLTGCLTGYFTAATIKKIVPEIDLVVPFEHVALIPRLLKNEKTGAGFGGPVSNHKNDRFITGSPHSVYIKIAEGCDNRCAYCLIPLLRGRLRSRPIDDIVSEVKALRKLGTREINIIAQDTTAYGKDLYGRYMLVPLLEQLTRIKGLHWIRLLYAQPGRITDDLIKLIAQEEKICKYLDIPVQHIDEKVLGLMGRKTPPGEITALYAKIREQIPAVVLRTTVMVGYPGEGEQEFNNLLTFLERYPFERLGVFCFSPERRTRAFHQAPRVAPQVALKRLHEVMSRQKERSRLFNRRLLGKTLEIMVDSCDREKNLLWGRYFGQAPEVDGLVYLPRSRGRPGDIIRGIITGAGAYDLIGEMKMKPFR